MLKSCNVENVGELQMTLLVMKSLQKQNETDKQVKEEVLSRLNMILRNMERISAGLGLYFDFSNGYCSPCMTGASKKWFYRSA